jgi:hypothetical protein
VSAAKKEKTQLSLVPKADPLADIADELGTLDKELGPWRGKLAREELLRKLLRNGCTAADDAEQSVEGRRFTINLGARGNERHVNVIKLMKLISLRAFGALASVTLAALEANQINPAVVAAVVESARTGHRSIKIFEKALVPAEKAA